MGISGLFNGSDIQENMKTVGSCRCKQRGHLCRSKSHCQKGSSRRQVPSGSNVDDTIWSRWSFSPLFLTATWARRILGKVVPNINYAEFIVSRARMVRAAVHVETNDVLLFQFWPTGNLTGVRLLGQSESVAVEFNGKGGLFSSPSKPREGRKDIEERSARVGNDRGATGVVTILEERMATNAPKLLKAREVWEMLGISKATLYRMIDKGQFPKQVKPSPGTSRWHRHEVEDYIAALPRE